MRAGLRNGVFGTARSAFILGRLVVSFSSFDDLLQIEVIGRNQAIMA
jgi:hypothetical protein